MASETKSLLFISTYVRSIQLKKNKKKSKKKINKFPYKSPQKNLLVIAALYVLTANVPLSLISPRLGNECHYSCWYSDTTYSSRLIQQEWRTNITVIDCIYQCMPLMQLFHLRLQPKSYLSATKVGQSEEYTIQSMGKCSRMLFVCTQILFPVNILQ